MLPVRELPPRVSHYWEMMFEQAGKRPVPHGTQVGVGTVLILKLVEALRRTNVDFDAARAFAKAYPSGVGKARASLTWKPRRKRSALTLWRLTGLKLRNFWERFPRPKP